ncbi:MAG: hypothetical protein NTW01_17190 [Gammaproteobacteria bacterium]|nr:hypothetical protein [Gammaproteobacteria bacterium]
MTRLAGKLSWTWKQIPVALEVQDRPARKDFLHLSAVTDGDGAAMRELQLSCCAGDRFLPMACSAEDPHLAKYIDSHAKLGARKPVACSHPIAISADILSPPLQGGSLEGCQRLPGRAQRPAAPAARGPRFELLALAAPQRVAGLDAIRLELAAPLQLDLKDPRRRRSTVGIRPGG